MKRETDCEGFSLLEVLFAGTIMALALLAILGTFATVYGNVTRSGRTTMGITATRQLFEDIRTVPFANLTDLNGFDTDDPATLPAGDPARTVARRWRYALAGEGVGWSYTSTEKQRWRTLTNDGQGFGGSGELAVAPQGANLMAITARVNPPGAQAPIEISTLASNVQ